MNWNPYLNAISAALYIGGVVYLISYISELHRDTPDNWLGTATALSLMVLSAAVMGLLFFYRPVALLIENKKSEAFSFFIRTLLTFGFLTLATLLLFL